MIEKLLSELRRREIRIWAEGERLKYEAPAGALDDELLAQLREHKQTLLRRFSAANGSAPQPIPRADRTRPLPLSFSQQRMWFLWRLAPDSSAYNVPVVLKVSGPLNVAALVESLRRIQQRHEVLRTHFAETPEGVRLVIEDARLEVPFVSLTEGTPGEKDEEAKRLILEEAVKPFDLGRSAPFEARLYRLSDAVHWCLIKLHHIVFDGWSNRVFMEELFALYQAVERGEPCELPGLPVQYADFALWQRERFQGPLRERLVSYWKQQLAGDLTPLRLPTDRPPSPARSMRGDIVPFHIPADLTARLSKLGQGQRATMFMMLMGALRVLLYRYSGQTDFLIGTPTIRRLHQDTEQLIGYFGNTLVLRNPLRATDSYLDVVAGERRSALDSYEHQEVPFDVLVEEIAPDRALSRSPLFQVVFLFGERAPAVEYVGDLTVEYVQVEPTTAKFDLGLWVMQAVDGLRGHIEYASDLFDRETVARMTVHFETILQAMALRPEEMIGRTPLLTALEAQTVLREWNDTALPPRTPRCLHELFEAQAEANPQAVAVYHGSGTVTYSELNAEANRLAARLLARGVRPEQLVGVCLRRTPRLIAALLAVLKAGAAYVPIDPNYPRERISLMLEDSRVEVLLTESSLVADLPPGECQLLLVDEEETSAREEPGNLPGRATPDKLAYVIYTSGSTGRPKGVMIEHRNAAALLDWAYGCYSPAELACVLAATSVCFDLSIFELFVPLCGGYSVLLAENALELFTLPARDAITLINTVPSVMRTLLRAQGGAFPRSLQVVNLAGELLETQVVDEVYRRTRAKKVFDLYGPTEATTYSTFKLRIPRQPASIGRPVSNTRAYVLDGCGMPVPVGVVGELYLAGEGLARGYLNSPALTSEKFVPPPSGSVPETRLYRTGDLVKFTKTGEIEFQGRNDEQLKVRGYRIEPGEVRAALLTADGVQDALVVGRKGQDGEVALTAYLIGDAAKLSAQSLRPHLRQRLPEHMIPSVFVPVAEFPSGPNGKVDLARLCEAERRDAPAEHTPPETETERQLVEIWREVLGVEQVGVHDSFFDLGGHSMTAMLVIGRVNQAFDTDLSLPAIFQHPTVYELAAEIEITPRGSALPPVRAHASTEAPATLLQHHLWLVHHAVNNPAFLNIWEYVSLKGAFDLSAASRAWEALVERHPILRTQFIWDGEELQQQVVDEVPPNFFFDDLSEIDDDETRRQTLAVICYEAGRPFDISRGPCFRLVVVRMAEEHHLLIMVMHHIIVDEWSLAVLSREFAVCYAAYSNGLPSPLPAPALTFADYANWEQECLDDGLFDKQLALWKERLRPPLARLKFSWQDERACAEGRVESHPIEIPEPLAGRLAAVARLERSSLFVVLLSALKRALHRQTGASDIRVSTNVARRHRRDFENLIGPLTDTLVLRTELPAQHTPLSALRLLRSNFVEAYGHQDIPFEEMASRLTSESGIRREDLAQVFFLFHEEDAPAPPLPGLAADADDTNIKLGTDFFTAAPHGYDLILYLSKVPDGIRGQLTLRGQMPGRPVAQEISSEYRMLLEELAEASELRPQTP